MTRKVLAIEANYEALTSAAWAYREAHVYPHFEANGFEVIRLVGPQAIYAAVRDALADLGVVMITGSGHGLPDKLNGYYDEAIFEAGLPYPGTIGGKLVHFVSCGCARILGRDLVLQGATAFVGYDADFCYLPASAPVFFECDAEIDRALAEGYTVGDAVARAKALFERRKDGVDARTAGLLDFDLAHLTSPASGTRWGDPAAHL